MKDNVPIDIRYLNDDRFINLCSTIQETLEEIRELKIWTFIETLGLKPYTDGKLWYFSYGRNIRRITVSGNTPFEAAVNLYEVIR